MNIYRRPLRGICVLSVLVALAAFGWMLSSGGPGVNRAEAAPPAASRQDRDEGNGHEDHAKRTAEMKKSFDGSVDLFHSVEEIANGKPGQSGLTFVGLADVTGKELLVFSKGSKEQWLIDPDFVVAFRVNKK
jgi:hypothetical protein